LNALSLISIDEVNLKIQGSLLASWKFKARQFPSLQILEQKMDMYVCPWVATSLHGETSKSELNKAVA